MGKAVLQSFVDWPVTVNFRDEEGNPIMVGGQVKTVTIPSLARAPKNILVLSSDDFKAVHKDLSPLLTLGRRKGVVELDEIPDGFWDPEQRVAAAEGKLKVCENERDDALLKAMELEEEIEKLKKTLVVYGWKG